MELSVIEQLNVVLKAQGMVDDVQFGEKVMFDVETYPNYFLLVFLFKGEYSVYFEMRNNQPFLNQQACAYIFNNFVLVGFNSNNYDLPLVEHFLSGQATNTSLYQFSKRLIESGERAWIVQKDYPRLISAMRNSYDLMEVAPDPNKVSLKTYAARLLVDDIQDLPFNPHKRLTDSEIDILLRYCLKDVKNTYTLNSALKTEVEMREFMSKQYRMDLRSLSDAQIGERVVAALCEKRLGREIPRPDISKIVGTSFKYILPDYIKFQTPVLQKAAELVSTLDFFINDKGSPILPKELAEYEIKIGSTSYNLQIGGLHSQESTQAYVCDENHRLSDVDVDSFYPFIIINNKYFPQFIGEVFLEVYKHDLVEPRLDYKHKAADESYTKEERAIFKQLANSLKIVINGIYGKLGNLYSKVYSPEFLVSVCLTGQLSLLMLIERLEIAGLKVISANTDGIVIYYDVKQRDSFDKIVKQWERDCSFTTEENFYHALYSRDVNNYIAIKSDKDCQVKKATKLKGVYTDYWYRDVNSFRMKNTPSVIVCRQAVVDYLMNNTPIEETIYKCDELMKFTFLQNVTGGGVYRGEHFGRVARYYKSNTSFDGIFAASSGNTVPNSQNSKLCLKVPKEMPVDVDYDFYIDYARNILYDIGAKVKDFSPDLF